MAIAEKLSAAKTAVQQRVSEKWKKSPLSVVRGVVNLITIILFISTVTVLGQRFDQANFPGSNIVLKVYDSGDKEGKFYTKDGSYLIEDSADYATEKCSNFIEQGDSMKDTCGSVKEDQALPLVIEDKKGNEVADAKFNGWIVAPNCNKNTNVDDCALFGALLSGLGTASFASIILSTLLHGFETAFHKDKDGRKPDTVVQVINGLWMIVTIVVLSFGAVYWVGFCDKIDTGLGRKVGDDVASSEHACATIWCAMPFEAFFGMWAAAIFLYNLPEILQLFGFFEKT